MAIDGIEISPGALGKCNILLQFTIKWDICMLSFSQLHDIIYFPDCISEICLIMIRRCSVYRPSAVGSKCD